MVSRQERDQSVISELCHLAHGLRREYAEWVQQEVKELLPVFQSFEATTSGTAAIRFSLAVSRIQDINNNVLDVACEITERRIKDAKDFEMEIVEAYSYVQDGLSRLESLIRELMRLRAMADSLTQDPPAQQSDSDN